MMFFHEGPTTILIPLQTHIQNIAVGEDDIISSHDWSNLGANSRCHHITSRSIPLQAISLRSSLLQPAQGLVRSYFPRVR
jgi:hypothetical protein